MRPQLQSLFDSIEKERDSLLRLVSALPEDIYNRVPAPGKWSIAQIMTHLMVAEQLSLRYIKKKSLGIDSVKDSGVVEEIKFRLLQISQRLPFKFKAPTIVLENTPQALPLSELQIQWKAFREELGIFLSTIQDNHHRRMIYKHAVAGRLNVMQALRFFTEHIHHHRPQINRIIRSSNR
jgi:uncharacterized damage-inducible protein DinB